MDSVRPKRALTLVLRNARRSYAVRRFRAPAAVSLILRRRVLLPDAKEAAQLPSHLQRIPFSKVENGWAANTPVGISGEMFKAAPKWRSVSANLHSLAIQQQSYRDLMS